MLVPASIHFAFNHGTSYQSGIGIPTATDIAFSLGVLVAAG
jgi:NhaA family Na+:H+ antiporter